MFKKIKDGWSAIKNKGTSKPTASEEQKSEKPCFKKFNAYVLKQQWSGQGLQGIHEERRLNIRAEVTLFSCVVMSILILGAMSWSGDFKKMGVWLLFSGLAAGVYVYSRRRMSVWEKFFNLKQKHWDWKLDRALDQAKSLDIKHRLERCIQVGMNVQTVVEKIESEGFLTVAVEEELAKIEAENGGRMSLKIQDLASLKGLSDNLSAHHNTELNPLSGSKIQVPIQAQK